MLGNKQLYLFRLIRSIWFLPTAYAVGSVLLLAVAPSFDGLVPPSALRILKPSALESILRIIATSMLAVAIFSLGTMVTSLEAASRAATPRARVLLTEDRTAQTAISTFIGAFIFSILGIIGLSADYYNEASVVTIFTLTIIVIVIVIVTLISWISKLSRIGGVGEVVNMVEQATCRAFKAVAESPFYGGKQFERPPTDCEPICPHGFDYLQHIDGDTLGELTEKLKVDLYVLARPGTLVSPSQPVVLSSKDLDDEQVEKIRDCFVLGDSRTFEEDPRFGLLVLSEIASRALSPASNDPGTAIQVLSAFVRVMRHWRSRSTPGETRFPRLRVQALNIDKVVIDGLRWIARDGAGHLEVSLKLQRALAEVRALDSPLFGAPVERMSKEAFERAEEAMTSKLDISILAESRKALHLAGEDA